MSFHKNLTLDDIHALPARVYADITARDADTAFHVIENINKAIRVDSPSSIWVLVSVGPAVWLELSSVLSDSFLELNDTPSDYSGQALRGLRVNAAEDAVEFGPTPDGDVLGPGSSTDNAVVRFLGTSGKLIQESLVYIDNAGSVGVGIPSPARRLHMQANNSVLRIDRDANSPAVILARFPAADFTTPWKTFFFGVPATGSDDGSFVISDMHTTVSGGGDDRFVIDTDGNISIPGKLGVGIAPNTDALLVSGVTSLEGVSTEETVLRAKSNKPFAIGVGGQLSLYGRANAGPSLFEGAAVKAEKYSATSGQLGFDCVLYAHKNPVGALVEMARFSAEGGFATIAEGGFATIAEISMQGDSDDNIFLGEERPASWTTGTLNTSVGANLLQNLTEGDGNIVIGNTSGAGIAAGSQNIIVGSFSGNDTGGISTDIDDNNILIGFTAETINGLSSNVLNIGNMIWGALGDNRVRIGGGQSTALLSSAALEVVSTIGAFIPPRMTTTERNAMIPVNGMMIYDTTQNAFRFYEAGAWRAF